MNHQEKTSFSKSTGLKLLLAILLLSSQILLEAQSKGKHEPTWEEMTIKGNEYRERNKFFEARRNYEVALKIEDKLDIHDLRRAIILHDIAESYRGETNFYRAKMTEVESHAIYKEEIKNRQLGYEYTSKKPIQMHSGSLRPACYLCHENWKVVPILYGESTGYDGEIPEESSSDFTHKHGGKEPADQRWYCRECRQSF